jgi:hypothetical protein
MGGLKISPRISEISSYLKRCTGMKIHESITAERVMEAVEAGTFGLENPGICIDCGEDADGVEPDAVACECEACGAFAVYGAEELLLYVD